MVRQLHISQEDQAKRLEAVIIDLGIEMRAAGAVFSPLSSARLNGILETERNAVVQDRVLKALKWTDMVRRYDDIGLMDASRFQWFLQNTSSEASEVGATEAEFDTEKQR